jgi:CheY-like chemotaxis protein
MTKVTGIRSHEPVRLINLEDDAASDRTPQQRLNILIVDHDRNCTDALELLLSDMANVGSIATAPSVDAAIAAFTRNDCIGWLPDVIFIDPQTSVDRVLNTQSTLRALRQQLPDASIVLLSVYTSGLRRNLRALVDHAIRKDVSRHDLRAMIDTIASTPLLTEAATAAG